MKVKSFGCSFIYGSELHDDRGGLLDYPSQLTWPALLAQTNNLGYQCFARPGAGNMRIAESVLNEISSGPSYFVIGWTWIDRFDYRGSDPYKQNWETIRPSGDTKHSRYYYKYFNDQYSDKLSSLILINTVLTALKNSSHKFLMTYQDELLFETAWHTSPAVEYLQQQIKPAMTKFNDKTFLDWSRECGYKISPNMHPLEDAHRAGAELMKNYFLV